MPPRTAATTRPSSALPCPNARRARFPPVSCSPPKQALLNTAAPGAAPRDSAAGACQWSRVYLGRSALIGMEGLVGALPQPLSKEMLLHTFVAFRGPPEADSSMDCWLLDFLPVDPTSPATALALASGGAVPGRVRSKRLRQWVQGPGFDTRLIGQVDRGLSGQGLVDAVEEFNSAWSPQLRLLSHDCRSYCEGLLQRVTGAPIDLGRAFRA